VGVTSLEMHENTVLRSMTKLPADKLGRIEVAVLKRFASLAVKREWFVDISPIDFDLAVKHVAESVK
jgi:hypothetical protein